MGVYTYINISFFIEEFQKLPTKERLKLKNLITRKTPFKFLVFIS